MSLETRIVALATQIGTDIKGLRTSQGDLSSLSTTVKTSLVAALNELATSIAAIGGSTVIDDAAAGSATTFSSTKINNLIATAVADLVNNAPAALDTLNELATALNGNANFATDIATALGNRVRVDASQSFTAPEQQQARDNIGAAEAAGVATLVTNLGNLDTDFAAGYITARDA